MKHYFQEYYTALEETCEFWHWTAHGAWPSNDIYILPGRSSVIAMHVTPYDASDSEITGRDLGQSSRFNIDKVLLIQYASTSVHGVYARKSHVFTQHSLACMCVVGMLTPFFIGVHACAAVTDIFINLFYAFTRAFRTMTHDTIFNANTCCTLLVVV